VASVELSKFGYQMPAGLVVNYDHMFRHSDRGFWNAGAGIGGFGFTGHWRAYSARTTAGYNLGRKQNFLQLGIGASYVNEYYVQGGELPPRSLHYYVGPQIGYKRVSEKRFQFGSYIGLYAGTDVFVGGGISFGWAFGTKT
jgi:hypothetical protein